jgi:hypothetical protein
MVGSRLRSPHVIFILLILLLLFTRFFNLSQTARFTNDEASDLARLYQLGHNFKLTLVGPISNDNTKVFGSLTYYMQLPFVMALNYSAVSPAVGTAFWSVITTLIIIFITYKSNNALLVPVAFLAIAWYPLVETGRWAWNPHFMPLWIFVALLFHLKQKPLFRFFEGISLGLSVHHHYIAIVAIVAFYVVEGVGVFISKENKKQQALGFLAMVLGLSLALSPFVLFDLRHPPGLFFRRYLLSGETPNLATQVSNQPWVRLQAVINEVFLYVVANSQLVVIFLLFVFALIVLDLKYNRRALGWLLPVIAQLGLMVFVDNIATRYFLPALPFFIMWLITKRVNKSSQLLVIAVIVFMTTTSLIKLPELLLQTRVHPSPVVVDGVVKIIREIQAAEPTPDVNIATHVSPDKAPLAELYRHVLGMHGVGFKQPSEYDTSSRLYVVSTGSEVDLRNDNSVAMSFFKDASLKNVMPVGNTGWQVYWFQK